VENTLVIHNYSLRISDGFFLSIIVIEGNSQNSGFVVLLLTQQLIVNSGVLVFNYQHYVPILKVRPGEIGALMELDAATAKRLTPVLIFPRFSDVVKEEISQNAIDNYLVNLLPDIKGKWPFLQRVFVDLQCFDNQRAGSENFVEYIFDKLEEYNILGVPVVSFSCSQEFKAVTANINGKCGCGIAVVIEDADYGVVSIQNLIQEMLASLACKPGEVDIILDYKIVNASLQQAIFASAVFRISALPHLQKWRSLTMAAVSYPRDTSEMQKGMNRIPRVEWKIWHQILKTPLKRIPTFGDYNTFSPSHPDRDPRKKQPEPRLRYTIDSEWLILNEKDIDKLSTDEFTDICYELVQSPEFCGKQYSWGDNFIARCADGKENPESPEIWHKVCSNHHLTFITKHITKIQEQ